MAEHALSRLQASACKHKYTITYGSSKTAIVSSGIADQRPLPVAGCDRSNVHFVSNYVCLGVVRTTPLSWNGQLHEIEIKSFNNLNRHMEVFLQYDFEISAVLRCIDTVTKPACLYGASICVSPSRSDVRQVCKADIGSYRSCC